MTLRAYLAEHCREFVHNGVPLDPADVQDWIVSQARWLMHAHPTVLPRTDNSKLPLRPRPAMSLEDT
jgi:hypothetical protein